MNYKGIKDKEYSCKYCKKIFKVTHYRANNQKPPQYCSHECQYLNREIGTEQLFYEGKIRNSLTQRKYLAKARSYQCEDCHISKWRDKQLVLQVDHIDGNPANNSPSNLRLMCPNCHSLTPTYKGGNKKCPKTDYRSILHRQIYKKRQLSP